MLKVNNKCFLKRYNGDDDGEKMKKWQCEDGTAICGFALKIQEHFFSLGAIGPNLAGTSQARFKCCSVPIERVIVMKSK